MDDLERLEALIAEKARLEVEIAQLQAEVSHSGRSMTDQSHEDLDRERKSAGAGGRRQRPVRELLLDALDDLSIPAFSRELALYSRARFGREVSLQRFGPLAKDELTAYQRLLTNTKVVNRPVWLCFCLTDRFERVGSLWSRSDWPLDRRILCSTTGRVQHLTITLRLAQLALQSDDVAADPTMLKIVTADHARGLPGVKVTRGRFDLDLWIEVAARELRAIESIDSERRMDAAARLARQSPEVQLFGFGAFGVVKGSDAGRTSRRTDIEGVRM